MTQRQLEHDELTRPATRFPISLLADDLELPMNIGSLFRIADALGVETLYLSGRSPLPPNPKIRRTARATEQAVAWEYHADAVALVERLRARGDLIVSLEITAASIDLRQFQAPPEQRICLLVGSENRGIRPELLSRSDQVIHIPMFGQNSSMNVAAACAIAVFELGARRIETLGRPARPCSPGPR